MSRQPKKEKSPKDSKANITSVLVEERVFKPSPKFSKDAHIKSFSDYKRIYFSSMKNPQKFWAKIAGELDWFKKWKQILLWKPPFVQWFVGGKLNVSYNCLDRHLSTWRKNKAAILWEGEP